MKLTKTEWRYLQRIALDHPYYDTHKPPLTEAEARAIVDANVTMTGKAFVDSVYAKLGMTRPAAETKRFARLRGVGELLSVPPIRRIAITVLAVILLTVFFAATPVGRTIAENVIRYFAVLFDDGRIAVSMSDNDVPMYQPDRPDEPGEGERANEATGFLPVRSFEAFAEITGKTPAVLPMPCSELYYVDEPDIGFVAVTATYETPDGRIDTYQIWETDSIITSSRSGFQPFNTDGTIYCSTEESGKIDIKIVYEDSFLTILAKGTFSAEDLLALLKGE